MKKITLIILLFCASFINAQEENYTIKNSDVNTEYRDYGVSYFKDSTVLFSSSRKYKSISSRLWKGDDQPYLQLYQASTNEDGEIVDVELFSKKINTKFHEADITFTKDLKTAYFSANNYFNSKFKKDTTGTNLIQLYKAKLDEKGEWEVEKLPFTSDNYQTGHPALNEAEDKLYFISDMPGSFGKTDLYVVDILTDGTYSEPINLGPKVNTIENEMFPFIDEYGVLYFSSNGYEDGLGGLDIYASRLLNGLPERKAVNIGTPINSAEDDFALIYKTGVNTGYFSSNRPGGKGYDDIYLFVAENRIDLDCLQLASGIVTEFGTDVIIPNALVKLYDKEGVQLDSVMSNELGEFSLTVKCDTEYKVIGTKENYTEDTETFTTSSIDDAEVELTLALNVIVTINSLIADINPIYFDLDESYIRPDAAIELEKIVEFMNDYPEITVELGSHTDSRANDAYNIKLSERRAKSSMEWMISNGIDPSRITGKGYGETQLVNECSNGVKCTEEQHQLNRRTEFVIINPEAMK